MISTIPIFIRTPGADDPRWTAKTLGRTAHRSPRPERWADQPTPPARPGRGVLARAQLHRSRAHPARPGTRERGRRRPHPARLRRGLGEDPHRGHPDALGSRSPRARLRRPGRGNSIARAHRLSAASAGAASCERDSDQARTAQTRAQKRRPVVVDRAGAPPPVVKQQPRRYRFAPGESPAPAESSDRKTPKSDTAPGRRPVIASRRMQ
jgi:hypothetical protein